MKAIILIFLLAAAATLVENTDAFDYCYRANFSTSQATSGTAASRSNDVETAVENILNELRNDTSLDFTNSASNQTLEQVLTGGYVVLICFTNTSKTQDEFTQILDTLNVSTQIDSASVNAADFDECGDDYNATNCDSDVGICNNNNGSFACACPDTYFDNSTNNATGESCVLPTNHTCGQGVIDVSAYFPYFSALGIAQEDLKIGDCNGTLSGDNLLFSGECSPSVETNGTHNIYTWNLTNVDPDSDVTIGNYVIIPLICSSEKNGTVNASYDGNQAKPIEFGENLFLDLGAGQLQIRVEAFFDTGFLNAFTEGGSIKTNQDLSFKIGPPDGYLNDNIKTVCQGLTSAPAEGTSEPSYLIRSGCKVSDSGLSRLLDTLNIIEQGTSAQASLSIKSHFYSNSQQTQLGFEVYTCLESGGSSCEPSCNARRRRSEFHFRTKRQSVLGSGVGYFLFVRDQSDICTRDCGNGICVIDPQREQRCACNEEYSRIDASGKCIPLNGNVTPREQEQVTFIVLIALISVLVIGALGMMVLFLIRRKRKDKNLHSPSSKATEETSPSL